MVISLARQHAVVVKRGRFLFEVPFPNHGGLVSSLFYFNGEELSLWWNISIEVQYSIGLRILAGNDASPARGTDGIIAEYTIEPHSIFSERINGGSRV